MSGINRYMVPAEIPVGQQYFQLPINELATGLAARQGTYDLGLKDLETTAALDDALNSLTPDRARHLAITEEINALTDNLSVGIDLSTPEGKKQLLDAKRKVQSIFGPQGKGYAIQNSYDAYQAWDKEQQDRLKKGTITPEMYEYGKAKYLNDYQNANGIGERDPKTGTYNTFTAYNIADKVVANEKLSDYVKNIKASSTSVEKDKLTGDLRYILTTENGIESLTEEEVLRVAVGKLIEDDEVAAYYRQQEEFGMIPEGSFTKEPIYKTVYADVNNNIIDEATFESLTPKEKSKYYAHEGLNPNYALASTLQAIAEENSFSKTTFSQTRKADDYAKINYKYDLENAVANIEVTSEGITTTNSYAPTVEGYESHVDNLQSHSQTLLDETFENLGLPPGSVTPNAWLNGRVPQQILAKLSPDVKDKLNYAITQNKLQQDITAQTLTQVKINSGLGNLEKGELELLNVIDDLPDGEIKGLSGSYNKEMLRQAMGKINRLQTDLKNPGDSDYYVDGNTLMKNTKINEVSFRQSPVAVLPPELSTKIKSVAEQTKEYNKNLKENLKGLHTKVNAVETTTNAYWVPDDPVSQNLQIKAIDAALVNNSYVNDLNVIISEADLQTVSDVTGIPLKKLKQDNPNGTIPFKNLAVMLPGIARNKNALMFSSQPLANGVRFTNAGYTVKGEDGKEYDLTVGIELGPNGLHNKEIDAMLNSTAAEAQEIILRPQQSNVPVVYTDARMPNTIFEYKGAGPVLINGNSYTSEEAFVYVEAALKDFKSLQNLKSVDKNGQKEARARQLSIEKNIPLYEAIELILNN